MAPTVSSVVFPNALDDSALSIFFSEPIALNDTEYYNDWLEVTSEQSAPRIEGAPVPNSNDSAAFSLWKGSLSGLKQNTSYRVGIKPDLKDKAGNLIKEYVQKWFTGPIVTLIWPPDSLFNSAADSIKIEFVK
ncbi:MAG: Ig-like domain-containing protein, partial [bacterium]